MFAAFANRFRLYKLGAVDQFVMMYGGMRGGVAFALALLVNGDKVPHAPMFVTTTIAVVFWTSFVQGITIKPLVKMFGLRTMEEKNPTMNERIGVRTMDHIIAGLEGVLGEFAGMRQRDMYNYIDQKFIKPWLLRDPKAKDQKILETFEKRIQDDAITFMRKNPTEFTRFEQSIERKTSFHHRVTKKISSQSVESKSAAVNLGPRRGSGFSSDSEMHNVLSDSMIQPTRRRRMSSVTRLSVRESDILDTDVQPGITRHQLMTAARKMSFSNEERETDEPQRDEPTTLRPMLHMLSNVSELSNECCYENESTNKEVDPSPTTASADTKLATCCENPAFENDEEDVRAENEAIKDLDNVIQNVKLE